MEDKYILGIVCVICITALEGVALYLRIDGVIFASVLAAIGSILSFVISEKYVERKVLSAENGTPST